MRCFYCSEEGTSSAVVAICLGCGAAVCPRHVVRTYSPPPLMAVVPHDDRLRGPLRCTFCADEVLVARARSAGSQTAETASSGHPQRWDERRARLQSPWRWFARTPQRWGDRQLPHAIDDLTAADAVAAAEHWIRSREHASLDQQAPPARSGLFRWLRRGGRTDGRPHRVD